jgi:protein O-GlcNAc transferase
MSFSRTPPSSSANGPAARLLARASQLRRDGRHREAVEAMRLAASLEPNNAQVLYDLGVSCLGAGLFAEAANACRRAVQIKPDFAPGFWRLGVALGHCGEAEAAIDALQKATEL